MTPEQNFLKKLDTFLEDGLSELSKKRIAIYLEEYKKEIPPRIQVKTVTREILKKVYLSGGKTSCPVKPVTDLDMRKTAEDLCAEHGANIKDFLHPKGRLKGEMVALRRIFCRYILDNFVATQNQLKNFFNVDHSTVSWYVRGKRFKPLPPIQIKIKQTA